MDTKAKAFVPIGILSLEQYEAFRELEEETRKIEELVDVIQQILSNICSSQIPDKKAAITSLIQELSNSFEEKSVDVAEQDSFNIFKDNDGVWRWIGIFSNNVIDRHGEIITANAHKEFVAALRANEWPYPELWIYHNPDLSVGKAQWAFYDEETGMSIMYGYFNRNAYDIAESLSKSQVILGMSHGMPISEMRFDKDDRRQITRYRDREVTVLAIEDAANLLTSFDVNTKDYGKMSELRHQLVKIGLPEHVIDALAEQAQTLKRTADIVGLETKQDTTLVEEIEVPTEVSTDAQDNADEEKRALLTVLEQLVKTFTGGIDDVNKSVQHLSTRLKALEVVASERHNEDSVRKDAIKTVEELEEQKPFGKDNKAESNDPLRFQQPKSDYVTHPLAGI